MSNPTKSEIINILMRQIELNDIKNIYEYEKIRETFRRKIIEEKRLRRVSVGPHITFAFENRDTVIFQIQEMVRVERLLTDEAMQKEVDVYNQLVPGDHELSATLLIEITEQSQIRPVLDSLVGLGHQSVFLCIGGHEIETQFDEGQSAEDRISAVQYLKWQLGVFDIQAMLEPDSASLVVRHKNYHYEQRLTDEQRLALLTDIRSDVPQLDVIAKA
jgi:hypothetical protein